MSARQTAVLQVLREILAPLIAQDGSHLYLLRLEENIVELVVTGRYAGSPALTLLRRRILEPALTKAAPGITVVLTSAWKPNPQARSLGAPSDEE